MKKILLAAFVLNFNLGFSQTKQETIQWLNETFAPPNHYYSDGLFNSYRVLTIKEDGTFVKDVKDYVKSNNKYIAHHVFSGSFKNFALNSVYSKVIKGDTYIYASCFNKGKCVDYKNYISDGTLAIQSQDDTILLVIIEKTNDQSLVERGKKAFNHLIKILGGKKEAF